MFNSSPPSAAYMRKWAESALVQVMTCRLFGAKPLPGPLLANYWLDSWQQISVKFDEQSYHFQTRKCIWKCRLPELRLLCPGGDGLTHWGRDKMDGISQATLSSTFSWLKMSEFRLKFHWSLFLRVQLTIFQHCFRWWLGAVLATSYYLNQWWIVYWRIYASLGPNEASLQGTELLPVWWCSTGPFIR